MSCQLVFCFTLRNRSFQMTDFADLQVLRILNTYIKSMQFYRQLIPFLYFAVPTPTPIKATTASTTPGTSTAVVLQLLLIAPVANDCNFLVIFL